MNNVGKHNKRSAAAGLAAVIASILVTDWSKSGERHQHYRRHAKEQRQANTENPTVGVECGMIHHTRRVILSEGGTRDAPAMMVNRQANRETGMENDRPRVLLLSFGYKYGTPLDAQMLFDLRALPNPFWVAGLRQGSGLDAAVAAYVLESVEGAEMLTLLTSLIHCAARTWMAAGKGRFIAALGCTGGHHRSVAMTAAVTSRLRTQGLDVTSQHRDLDREAARKPWGDGLENALGTEDSGQQIL